jgi:hypothetical protein
LLAHVLINDSVAAGPAYQMTANVTDVIGRSVELAVIAFLWI